MFVPHEFLGEAFAGSLFGDEDEEPGEAAVYLGAGFLAPAFLGGAYIRGVISVPSPPIVEEPPSKYERQRRAALRLLSRVQPGAFERQRTRALDRLTRV